MKLDKLLQDLKDILPENVDYEVGTMSLDKLQIQSKQEVQNIVSNFGEAIGWVTLSNKVVLIQNTSSFNDLDLDKLLELELFNKQTGKTLRVKLIHDESYSAVIYYYQKGNEAEMGKEECIAYEQHLVIRQDLQKQGPRRAIYRIGYVVKDNGKIEPKYQQFIGFEGV